MVAKQIIHLVEEAETAAYQRGWQDAIAHIMDVAKKGPQASASLSAPKKAATAPFTSPYKVPIIDLVLQTIRDKPGMTGADVIRGVMARDDTIPYKVADRTGRTSLARLKERGKVWQRSMKWYPTQEPTPEAAASETKE